MADLKWYVLRVVSGKEKKIKLYLETEVEREKLQEYVTQVLIPSEKVYEIRNGKKRVRERNFFPGYVLVEADLTHGEASHVVNSIPGVIGFLGEGAGTSKVPVELREREIKRIMGKEEETESEGEKLDNPYFVG